MSKTKQNKSRKPIYVLNESDPKFKAYRDSLSLYKKGNVDKQNYINAVKNARIDPSTIVHEEYDSPRNLNLVKKINPTGFVYAGSIGGGYNRDVDINPYTTYRGSNGQDLHYADNSNINKYIQAGKYTYRKPVQPVEVAPIASASIPSKPTDISKTSVANVPVKTTPDASAPTINIGQQVDSISYIPYQGASERRSNTTDFNREYRPEIQKLLLSGMSNVEAENTVLNEKKAIKLGRSKKYPGSRFIKTEKLPIKPKYAGGVSASGIIGAASQVAGTAGEIMETNDPRDVGSKAGAVIKDAGKYAAMGASIGSVFPGLGTVIGGAAGAVAGTVMGVVGANKASEEYQKMIDQKNIAKNMSSRSALSAKEEAEYNLKNMTNNRIPGLKKGTSSFNRANAIVANEEVIQDGNTKKLSVVPGQYDQSNPDKVPVNLPTGSSVFSNQESQSLPFGGSTPAEIAKRAADLEAKLDKKEFGDKKLSKLDEITIRLNRRAIEQATKNLNKYNMLIAPENNAGTINSFNGGVAETKDLNEIVVNAKGSSYLKSPLATTDVAENSNLGSFKPLNLGLDTNTINTVESVTNGLKMAPTANITATSSDNNFIKPLSSTYARKFDANGNISADFGSKISGPTISDIEKSVNKRMSTTDSVQGQDNEFNVNGLFSSMGSVASDIASLAPAMYNKNAVAEVEQPIYENRINNRNRYNIAPQVAESLKQRSIARFNNASMNTSTGAGQAFAADLYSRGIDRLSSIMDSADKMNNQYRDDYAARYNDQISANTAEDRRIRDVNMRNEATMNSFKRENAKIISDFAQKKKLESNQKKADLLNSNIWSTYSTALDSKTQDYIMKLISDYQKS